MDDSLLKMAQFSRERVPERVVHAKGSGAFGYFEVTHDVTASTKASFPGADADRGACLWQALGSGTPVAADDK